MIHCAACEKDVSPMTDMGENGKMLHVCPGCSSVLGAAKRPEPPKRVLSPAEKPRIAGGPELAGPTPETTTRVVECTAPVDLIAEAKKRLTDLDTELARLGALQRERRKLAAMIAAADAADADELPHAAE